MIHVAEKMLTDSRQVITWPYDVGLLSAANRDFRVHIRVDGLDKAQGIPEAHPGGFCHGGGAKRQPAAGQVYGFDPRAFFLENFQNTLIALVEFLGIGHSISFRLGINTANHDERLTWKEMRRRGSAHLWGKISTGLAAGTIFVSKSRVHDRCGYLPGATCLSACGWRASHHPGFGYGSQSAIKIFVSCGTLAPRFEAQTSFLPLGLNMGKPSKPGL